MSIHKTQSAGGVVVNVLGQVLVVNQNHNSWSLPKGHLDPGETALQAATREIYEESGISQLEYVKDLGHYERPRIGLTQAEDRTVIKQIYLFFFKTNQMELKPIDPDNPEARWVNKDLVAAILTHPKDKEYFEMLLTTAQI